MPNIINKKYSDKKRKIEIKNISAIISKICKNNKEIIEENDEQNWKNNKKNVRKIRKKLNVDKMINTNDSNNDQNVSSQNNTLDKENSEQDEKNRYTILHSLDINIIKENYMKKYSEYVESINKLALSNIDALIKNINIINFYNRKTENNINFIKGKLQIHLIESYTNILLYFDIFNDFKNYNFIYKNCEFLNTLLDHFWENISENKNHNIDTSTNELSKNIILFSEIYKLNQKLNEFFKEQFLLLNLKPKLLYFPSPNYFMCFYVHLSSKTDYNNPYEDEEDCATTRASSHSKHTNPSKERGENLNDIRDKNKNKIPDDSCKDLIGNKHGITHTQINPYFIDGSNKKIKNDNIKYNNGNYITRQNEEDNKSEYNSIITNDSFSANCNDVITDNELDNTLDHVVISENCCSNSNKKPNNESKNIYHGNYTMEVTHHVVACDEMKQTKYKDTKFQSKYHDSQFNKFEYKTDACKNDNFKAHKGYLKHNLNNNNNRKSIFNSYILCGNDSNKNKLPLNEDVKRDDCKIIEESNDSLKAEDFMQNSRIHENNSNANKPNCIPNSQIKFCINTDHGNNKSNIINNEKIDSEKSVIFKDSQNNLNDNILHLTNSGKGISYHDISFMSANEQSDQDENNNDDNDTENAVSPFDGTKMKLYDSVQTSNDFQNSQKEEEIYLCKGKNESIYENDNTNNVKNEYESVENMDNINANFNKSDFTDSNNNNMDKPSNVKPNNSNKNIRINLNIQSLYDAYVNLNDSSKNNNNYYDGYLPRSSAYNKYTDDKKNVNNNILKEDIKNVLYN
ncbi:asparagine-rich protein [Plasmodium yoelii yoelii]|uniref:Asparagine-rich protein n=2 Tax=Plasmodium yoelii TaxID=5861 RepID=Q7RGA1_PLAYO|nr:asparagine-rich protein [Plasmodium yoelii yoelii]